MNKKQVYKFDTNGIYLEPILLDLNETVPENCTEIVPEDGIMIKKFTGSAWGEAATEEDYNRLKENGEQIKNPTYKLIEDFQKLKNEIDEIKSRLDRLQM